MYHEIVFVHQQSSIFTLTSFFLCRWHPLLWDLNIELEFKLPNIINFIWEWTGAFWTEVHKTGFYSALWNVKTYHRAFAFWNKISQLSGVFLDHSKYRSLVRKPFPLWLCSFDHVALVCYLNLESDSFLNQSSCQLYFSNSVCTVWSKLSWPQKLLVSIHALKLLWIRANSTHGEKIEDEIPVSGKSNTYPTPFNSLLILSFGTFCFRWRIFFCNSIIYDNRFDLSYG